MPVLGQTPTRIHLIDSESVTWEQIGDAYPDPNDPQKLVRDVEAHALGGGSSNGIMHVGITLEGCGRVLRSGFKGSVPVDFTGTIVGWEIQADQSGSIEVQVLKKAGTLALPVAPSSTTDVISASAPIVLSSAQSAGADMSGLTGWTVDVDIWDSIGFNVVSATSITRATLYLRIASSESATPTAPTGGSTSTSDPFFVQARTIHYDTAPSQESTYPFSYLATFDFVSSVTVGNTILFVLNCNEAQGASYFAIESALGLTYTKIYDIGGIKIYVASVTTGGSETITVKGSSYLTGNLMEYQNVDDPTNPEVKTWVAPQSNVDLIMHYGPFDLSGQRLLVFIDKNNTGNALFAPFAYCDSYSTVHSQIRSSWIHSAPTVGYGQIVMDLIAQSGTDLTFSQNITQAGGGTSFCYYLLIAFKTI